MGFIPSADTVTLTAKLTPFGRKQLLANENSIITKFSLGDSDANYQAAVELGYGQIPNIAGEIGSDDTVSNSISSGINLRSKVVVNNTGTTFKAVGANSMVVSETPKNNGLVVVSGSDITQVVIDRRNGNTDGLVNLFATFGLPITEANKTLYNIIKDANGGFADTALNGLNQDKILVIAIDSEKYGEIIDGRTVKVEVTTSADTYTLYTTYQKTLTPLSVQDTKISESTAKSILIGTNIAFMFSDDIQKPNNNPLNSWATGFNTVKPFSVNKKELFNLITNTSINTYADVAVGVAYLDKGFIVITNPDIVNEFNVANDDVIVTLDSVSTEVSQDITCIVERGEFYRSTNPTYNDGDMIRVSEIGLYDDEGNLIALAKTNKHILIGANQFMALGIKITV